MPGATSQAAGFASGVAAALIESVLKDTGLTILPAPAMAKITQAATPNRLSNLNGSANLLLFSDIQPARVSSSDIGVGRTVRCTLAGGFGRQLFIGITASTTDASGASYVAYRATEPVLCTSRERVVVSIVIEKRDSTGALLWSTTIGVGGLTIAEAVDRLDINPNEDVFGERVNRLVIGPGGDVFGGGTTVTATSLPIATLDARVFRIKASDGSILWNRTIESGGADIGSGIVTVGPGQSILVAGSTNGTLGAANFGGLDAYVLRMSAADGSFSLATPKDVLQFGTAGDDVVYDIASFGTLFVVAGSTTGAFSGTTNLGGTDAFLAPVLDLPGQLFSGPPTQFGTSGNDAASVLLSGTEIVGGVPVPLLFAAGVVGGSLPGFTSQGGRDVFYARFDDALSNPPWLIQAGTAGDEATIPGLALGPDDLFVAAGTQLIKASRVSGLTAWTLPLPEPRAVVSADSTGHVYLLGGHPTNVGIAEKYQAF